MLPKHITFILLLILIIGCGSSGGGGSGSDPNKLNPTPYPESDGNAQINSPVNGSSFYTGDPIHLSGTCGEEDNVSMRWVSDKDNEINYWTNVANGINNAEDIIVYDLSVGEHQITLECITIQNIIKNTVKITVVNSIQRIPDTGQTISYTDVYGEDSDYSNNPQSYTKLDVNGNILDDSAPSWAMVKDNVTGLIWEVKTDDNGIHDKDHLYNDIKSANDLLINQLNNSNFGGCPDWRLPTISELSTLVNVERESPVINIDFFPNTTNERYLSSTSSLGSYWVDFDNGEVSYDGSSGYSVRAVCRED